MHCEAAFAVEELMTDGHSMRGPAGGSNDRWLTAAGGDSLTPGIRGSAALRVGFGWTTCAAGGHGCGLESAAMIHFGGGSGPSGIILWDPIIFCISFGS